MARNLSARASRRAFRRQIAETLKRGRDGFADGLHGRHRFAMRAAQRFFDDRVDDAEAQKILRGDLHIGRGLLRLRRIAPEDGGGGFGRSDRVDRMFQHQHAIAACNRNRAAGAAFAQNDGDIGDAERERLVGRAGNRFGLAALFRIDARKGAGRIDQRDDRQSEAVGKIHQPHRLAIALRPRHAEIMLEPRFRIGPLLLADDADGRTAKAREAADDRRILAKEAIARERREIGEKIGDVVAAMRPLRMARDKRLLPRAQIGIKLAQSLGGADFELRQFLAKGFRTLAIGEGPEVFDSGFDLGDRLFEV